MKSNRDLHFFIIIITVNVNRSPLFGLLQTIKKRFRNDEKNELQNMHTNSIYGRFNWPHSNAIPTTPKKMSLFKKKFNALTGFISFALCLCVHATVLYFRQFNTLWMGIWIQFFLCVHFKIPLFSSILLSTTEEKTY